MTIIIFLPRKRNAHPQSLFSRQSCETLEQAKIFAVNIILWNETFGHYQAGYLTVWKSPKDFEFLLTSNSFDQTSVRIFCFSFTDFRPPFFDSEARFTRDCATSQTKIGSSANTSEKSWNGQRFWSSVGKDSKNFIVWETSQNKSQKGWPRILTTRWIRQN